MTHGLLTNKSLMHECHLHLNKMSPIFKCKKSVFGHSPANQNKPCLPTLNTILPPPTLILAPRTEYLPLLAPLIKPYFSSTLPPGVDTIWFDYKGLPRKWYIPTGVLFDLLCPDPERPWNITVHFRGYPRNVLISCEGEDSVKWSFVNSLKEAAYIINGNCKNVMNMSQSDQLELCHFVMSGNFEAYQRVSSKIKLATVEDEYTSFCSLKS